MSQKKIDQLVQQLENYLECWKQFNYYLSLARNKQFTPEHENQFLEVKSVITQELESLLSKFETELLQKEDVLNLLGSAPSIRFLSELTDGSLRALENQWHKIFIAWQSILGQLKVKQREAQSKFFLTRLFSK